MFRPAGADLQLAVSRTTRSSRQQSTLFEQPDNDACRDFMRTCNAISGKAAHLGQKDDARSTQDHRTSVFFARAPSMVSHNELHQLFSHFGHVKEINLFRRWATAKTSKGCGIVHFDDHEAAAAALNSLNGQHKWPDSDAPMIVEWLEASKLKRSAAAAAAATEPAAAQPHLHPTAKSEGGQAQRAAAAAAATSPASQVHASDQQQQQQQRTKQQQQLTSKGNSSSSSSSSRRKCQSLNWESYEPCTAAQPAAAAAAADLQDDWSSPRDTSSASWLTVADLSRAGSVPVHLLPMLTSLAFHRSSGASDAGPMTSQKSSSCSSSSTNPGAVMSLPSMWSSSSPLPEAARARANCPAAGQDDWRAAINRSSSNSSSSCSTGSHSSLSNHGVLGRPLVPIPDGIPEGLMILQDDPWPSGSSNVLSGSSSNRMRSSLNGATSAPLAGLGRSRSEPAAACYSLFNAPAVPGVEDSGTNVLYSAALAFDSACKSMQAEAAAAAAAAAHDTALSQSSTARPGGLLDVIPSLDWLQLQQAEQQGQLNGGNLGRQSAVCPLPCTPIGSGYLNSPTDTTANRLSLEQQQYLMMGGGGSAAAAAAAAAAESPQELVMDLMPQTVSVICGCMDPIAKISKATLQINAHGGGMQLRLAGSRMEVDAAVELISLMLQR